MAERARRRECPHRETREVRLYMPYAEVLVVRARLLAASEAKVSRPYEIRGGWALALCDRCVRSAVPRAAVGPGQGAPPGSGA